MSSSLFPSEFDRESDATRYVLGPLIGTGSAGAVYLAEDRETGEKIALKKLLNIDTRSVLRLKREFRSLTDVHHPNLVKLYDLGYSGQTWFMTMEFVEGRDLLAHLGEPLDSAHSQPPLETNQGRIRVPDLARILPTFYQLACGVQALHLAKVLHRDLKPSNVLVAHDRVVVLDFGLAREIDRADLVVTLDGSIAGTPAYMPPEQAQGLPLSEVSDWYAFGAMLYQALTGRLPIDGRNGNELLRRKLDQDPVPLERMDLRLPEALSTLCMRLLSRDPLLRPQGPEILAALAPTEPQNMLLDLRSAHTDFTARTESQFRIAAQPLFGRERELTALREALTAARGGEPLVMHVRGASGAGKTALVEHFLERMDVDASGPRYVDALVLRSRCYEREAMPFKALDGVMDALVRHLSQLDDFDVAHLLPADIADLTRLFPALDRLRAVQRLVANAKPRADGMQSRMRAEHALRELFVRLAARHVVVLWIDDLQWGDLDSASVLESWLPHMSKASLLMVFSYRSEELHTSSCLRALLGSHAGSRTHATRARQQTLELLPLKDADVQQLCLQRLGAAAPRELIARIVQEAHGSPFLASQLTTLAQAQLERKGSELASLSMEELVVQSTALLSPSARALLHVLAIAGRPISVQTALRAAGIQREGNVHLHALKTLRLIRTREVTGERRLEVYHDRVREGVHAALSTTERERVYDRLLRELELSSTLDADWLHSLALGAHQRVPALRYGLIAAERASSTLAFERAAELYQLCLELTKPDAISGELWLKLALALARCRRGTQAAHAYLQAAELAAGPQRWPLLRLASTHLLRTGQFERGEQLVDQVLTALEQQLPSSRAGWRTAIAWERGKLFLGGGRYTPRLEAEVQPELREDIELYATLTVDTLAYDPVRASLFEARCMRLALQAGDPSSLVRAFCLAATTACVAGTERALARSETLLAQAETLARPSGQGRLERYVYAARAVVAYLSGQPLQVLEPALHAEHLYREDTRRDEQAEYYHLFVAWNVRIAALAALGDYARFLSELDSCLEKARNTQNDSVALHLTTAQTLAEQLRGQPELARARLDRERELLPKQRLGPLHVLHLIAVMSTASATGDYAWAHDIVEPMWKEYRSALVHRSAYLALLIHAEHARMLINEACDRNDTRQLPALVVDDLTEIEGSPLTALAQGIAQDLQARMLNIAGQRDRALALWREAVEVLDANGYRPDASRMRFALGRAQADTAGIALSASAELQLSDQGVTAPLLYLQRRYPELSKS